MTFKTSEGYGAVTKSGGDRGRAQEKCVEEGSSTAGCTTGVRILPAIRQKKKRESLCLKVSNQTHQKKQGGLEERSERETSQRTLMDRVLALGK